jgi:hypothetical protein
MGNAFSSEVATNRQTVASSDDPKQKYIDEILERDDESDDDDYVDHG